eukprot:Pgem_evm2s15928
MYFETEIFLLPSGVEVRTVNGIKDKTFPQVLENHLSHSEWETLFSEVKSACKEVRRKFQLKLLLWSLPPVCCVGIHLQQHQEKHYVKGLNKIIGAWSNDKLVFEVVESTPFIHGMYVAAMAQFYLTIRTPDEIPANERNVKRGVVAYQDMGEKMMAAMMNNTMNVQQQQQQQQQLPSYQDNITTKNY